MGKMYKTVQITCFTKAFYVTAFGFVGCILVENGSYVDWKGMNQKTTHVTVTISLI